MDGTHAFIRKLDRKIKGIFVRETGLYGNSLPVSLQPAYCRAAEGERNGKGLLRGFLRSRTFVFGQPVDAMLLLYDIASPACSASSRLASGAARICERASPFASGCLSTMSGDVDGRAGAPRRHPSFPLTRLIRYICGRAHFITAA